MSVEATALSRSKLEQKDRAELAAIVEAMGGKAGSRAKKADLVDQVLQLAGAGNPGGNGSQDEPKAPTVDPGPVASQSADEPPAAWELAAAQDPVPAAPERAPEPASEEPRRDGREQSERERSEPEQSEPQQQSGDRPESGTRDGGFQSNRDD